MPHSQKPIVCICGSRNISFVNLDLFIDPEHVGCVVSGGAAGVDTLAEQWAKRNKIEWVCYLPNYKSFGKRAPLIRDQEMVDFCDVVIAFWDGKSTGTKYTMDYAIKTGHRCICHIIQGTD